MKRSGGVLCLLGAMMLGPAAMLTQAAADAPQQIQMRLLSAVFVGTEPVTDGPSLILSLRTNGDRWERVWGMSRMCRGVHWGYVVEGSVTDQAIVLTMDINVEGDSWVKGGRGRYQVDLKRNGAGGFEGEYSGTYKGVAVKGRADATILPAPRPPPAGFQPVQPGEHPRILFRKGDLPALREKAKTALGQAALARMTDGIGLGIRYQLTGDRKFAEQSQAFVEVLLNGNYKDIRAPGSHHGMYHWGPMWEQVGVSYDLCYDAWPQAFKTRVERFLVLWTYRILYQHTMFNMQAMYDFGNYEAGWFYYGPALGCLALWGEKGPEPARPFAPDPVREIPAAADYKPGKDVPVLPLEPGQSPRRWLATQPLDVLYEGDPLEELGGMSKCRPENGTSFTCDGTKCVFEPLPETAVPPSGGVILNIGKSISLGHVKRQPGPEIKKDGPLTMAVYTVLDNAEPRLVKVHTPFTRWGSQQMVLNGHLLAHEQVVKLDKGLYPLLLVFRIRPRWDWMEPKLLAATEADVEKSAALLVRLQKQYEEQVRDNEWDRAEWKRTGGFSQDYQRAFEITRWVMFTHDREGIGSGGMQTSTAGSCATVGLLPATYTVAHRNVFGTDVSPYPDITHYVPRRVVATVYPESGPVLTQDINGPADTAGELFACNYPLVPEEWKPAMLWAWNRHADVSGPDDVAKVLAGSTDSIGHRAFLNYPLDPATGKTVPEPRPPAGILPLAWEAPDFGYYAMRSGWKGKDDFLVQLYGKTAEGHGYVLPNAGTFTILGLGNVWAQALPALRLHNLRSFSNVVLMPEDDTNEGALGRVAYAKTESDGSGVVTFDMGDVYAGTKRDAQGQGSALYEKYGRVRLASRFADSGVTGLRSFAVDYSGKSGAPCLFVVVDAIAGGKSKVWKWNVEEADVAAARVDGNAVTIVKADGAGMRLTFVSPSPAQVKVEKRSITYTRTYNRGEAEMPAPGIYAGGADPADGRFFVVATIQRGDAPAVTVEGKGLDAKVRVGKRAVRFDGSKVVLGE